MMAFNTIEFYECINPECKLRFPSCEAASKPKRCPLCRSELLLVRSTTIRQGVNLAPDVHPDWKIEVLMDNLRSAWNVGAILRTADGMGISTAYCCGITPTPDQAKVAKTALGAELTIQWEKHRNAVDLAHLLKSKGCALWSLEAVPEAFNLYDVESLPGARPIVLVVGNENCGVDPAILELCDKVISIPMLGNKQSYNVAIAFGMAVNFLFYCHNVSHGSLRILPST